MKILFSLALAGILLVSGELAQAKGKKKEAGAKPPADGSMVMGGIDKSVIDETMKKHMPQVRACYEMQLNSSKEKFEGRLQARFVIGGKGAVTEAGVESSTLQNKKVEDCVVSVIKHIAFPEPVGGGIVEVTYPFTFTPSL